MHRSVRRVTVTIVTAALAAVGLVVPALPAAAVEEAAATDLLISEYVEGSSFNKALEIANPTGAPVDLAAGAYSVRMSFNGGTTVANIPLTGTVAAGEVHVLAQSTAGPAILAVADQTSTTSFYNGDDAIVLLRGDNVVDSIGQLGVDPGAEWGTGLTSTADNTLRRVATVCAGDVNPSDAFDPAVEWVGFAQDTFDGLGVHTTDCGSPPPVVLVINEFSANTVGTDVEYVELLGTVGADLSAYRVLEIEGDGESNIGTVDEVISFATTADGRALASLAANALENGTMSLLLVRDFTGALGGDVDADDDGELDAPFPGTVVDSVAVLDGAPGDIPYGGVVLDAGDGSFGDVAPGGASRIPDGTDTDSPADWVRNDFDLAGIPGSTGTPIVGEALNTPGAANALVEVQEVLCEAPTVTIGSVQGPGSASSVAGTTVDVEGVVTGDFQVGGFSGYYLQDSGDDDAATSDGIFVYAPSGLDVSSGDLVHVRGTVSEFNGLTEITVGAAEVCDSGLQLPEPVSLQLPASDMVREPLEGMRVTLPQSLAVGDLFTYARFGELSLGVDRQFQPTAVVEPGSPERTALIAQHLAERIWLDDGRSNQNPDPLRHPNGEAFSRDNVVRSGDLVASATGILDWRFDVWRIQPTEGAQVTPNPRPAVPVVGGTTKVASFNVLNYFTTLDLPDTPGDQRGANSAEEFERQEAKIVAALDAIDADVFGLIEIENSDDDAPLDALVMALNSVAGAGTYAAIHTGRLGTDAITTALIYKPAEVAPVGAFAVLDSTVDPGFRANNRPALAQTFTDLESGGEVTVVVNHLKSKGSDCDALGDPDTGDGQGNCNETRVLAAEALADWLATDPTGQDTAGRELIIGDLNSYDHEDPIDALRAAGYTDLVLRDQGEHAYSYNFDGELGYLDYALAGPALVDDVTEAAPWNINSDESALFDYNTEFKSASQIALWAPDPYRSSDHDPVVVGLDLTLPDTTAPTLELTADPAVIFPANGKSRTVTIDVDAADESGTVAVQFLGATALGSPKADVQQVSANEFRMVAAKGAVYTFTYEARDGAGNTTTKSTVVIVGKG